MASRPATAPLVLLADIGGTNTRVALAKGHAVDHGAIRRFRNADYPDLSAILAAFLADAGHPDIAGACVAAAGPVRDGVAVMTNLSWRITPELLRQATGTGTVAIINDLQAQGHALAHLSPESLRSVLPGKGGTADGTADGTGGGTRLVIGVGTGINAAVVHRTPAGLLVTASECGHATLPVRTEEELRLAIHLAAAHGFPGIEEVLSGRGLVALDGWLAAEAGQPQTRAAAEIMEGIAAGDDPVARATDHHFQTFLGRVTGDLGLVHLPFGGIYLIGGVIRAFAPRMQDGPFARAFADKGRFSTLMAEFSVSVVEDDFAALVGCADHLAQVMGRQPLTTESQS